MLAIHAASAALDEPEFREYSLRMNSEAKDQLYQTLDSLKLSYVHSHANFVFLKTGRDIASVIGDMRQQGISVGRAFPPFSDWCRISTGKPEDMQKLKKALEKVFS
jgi:histidinol-phosphate aminotransferase